MSKQRIGTAVWLLVGALLLATLGFLGRRTFIRSFFADGSPGAPPSLSQPTEQLPPVPPVARLRVVLLDGLGQSSRVWSMSELDHLCANGLDLIVDNGFPTVSLPVQHVLWTGRTQTQSGVMYRIAALPEPPPDALPLRVPESVAVAQSHAAIVHSFGFTHALPSLEDEAAEQAGSAWQELDVQPGGGNFASAAQSAVAGPAALAFIHVLAIDEAGHEHGADSPQYRDAVVAADRLLAQLVAADPDPAATRWVVLSDHGHLPHGGHGDAEPSIRKVRACVFGGPPVADACLHAPCAAEIHLVDLHRLLAESLALAPSPSSRGRPLAFALAHPDTDATLPTPTPLAWLAAVLVTLAGVGVTAHAARRRVLAWPWWLLLAYLGQALALGVPTLSNPSIYPPLGSDMLLAALPGLALALVTAARWRDASTSRVLRAQLALAGALCLATLSSSGAIAFALGLTGTPPLVPRHTAHVSWLLSATTAGTLAVVTGLLLRRRPRDGDT